MSNPNEQPTVEFFRLVEAGRRPQRSDRSAGGTLPTRAFRYCEAVTSATALGWYIFPPISFHLLWTGTETFWHYEGAKDWLLLGAAQFPGFRNQFDRCAPDRVKTYSPPFLGALPEPGIIQVWSGLIARTKPDWSLVVRAPANLPRAVGYDVFEGVVETDRWFGPLFINIRLTRTDTPVEFNSNMPLFQAQPLHRVAYSDMLLNDYTVNSFDSLDDADWDEYYRTVVQPSQARCPHGAYAVDVRKRRNADIITTST